MRKSGLSEVKLLKNSAGIVAASPKVPAMQSFGIVHVSDNSSVQMNYYSVGCDCRHGREESANGKGRVASVGMALFPRLQATQRRLFVAEPEFCRQTESWVR